MSVGHICEPCKNGLADRDAVWNTDLGGPKEPCIRWGSRYPKAKRQFLVGKVTVHCIVYGHSVVSDVKTAEPIEMPIWDADSGRLKKPCIRMGLTFSMGRGTFAYICTIHQLQALAFGNIQLYTCTCIYKKSAIYKNSSGDEITNVNFFMTILHTVQNTKTENLLCLRN